MDALNYRLQVLNALFPDELYESWKQQQVDAARARYESALVEEACAIVEGRSMNPVNQEHLRVLLEWLDGTRCRLNREQPDDLWDGETPPF